MKTKSLGGRPEPVHKMPLLTKKDEPEYSRIKKELVEALQRMGGYEPAFDDLHIDQIARIAIYAKRVEVYLDSGHATVDTYFRVTDTKLKFSKMINDAIHELAVARRDRIGRQTESSLMNELREAMLRGLETKEQ